jgi:cytochrome bd-type quinol oxidase subunit 2
VEHRPADTASGPGRVLVGLYALFTLAAGARAGVQLATRFDQAPVAYLLSALAAVIYLVATVGLVRGGRLGRRTAALACSVELAGVLVVGTLSLVDPAAFPDATVWSAYGRGYGFVPLVLPVLGLLWLRHQAELAAEHEAGEAEKGGPPEDGSDVAADQKSPPPPKSPPP